MLTTDYLRPEFSSPDLVIGALNGVESLNLFPTENRMSPAALSALSTDSAQRYQFSEGANCFYGDTGQLTELLDWCDHLATKYFASKFAITTGLSGLNAMHAVITSFAQFGDVVYVVSEAAGGHYATQTICEKYGYKVEFLPYRANVCDFDYDAIEHKAKKNPPRVVYIDTSTLIKLPSMPKMREAVGQDAIICFDASQVLALVPNNMNLIGPGSGLDVLNGSTHKTMPGPQKGLSLTNDLEINKKLLENLPYYVSNPHANAVGALAITLAEMMPERVEYANKVVENANEFAAGLSNYGYMVAGHAPTFTETQQVWVDAGDTDTALVWARRLRTANIRVTVVPLPSAGGRAGLRMGVQELTRLGMSTNEMKIVSGLVARCLAHNFSSDAIRNEVRELTKAFSDVKFTSGWLKSNLIDIAARKLETTS